MSNSELNNYPPSYYAENDEKYQSIVKAYHGIKFSSFDNNITSRISVPYYTHLINKEMDIITYLTEMCIPKDFLEENYVCYHYNDLLAIQEILMKHALKFQDLYRKKKTLNLDDTQYQKLRPFKRYVKKCLRYLHHEIMSQKNPQNERIT